MGVLIYDDMTESAPDVQHSNELLSYLFVHVGYCASYVVVEPRLVGMYVLAEKSRTKWVQASCRFPKRITFGIGQNFLNCI